MLETCRECQEKEIPDFMVKPCYCENIHEQCLIKKLTKSIADGKSTVTNTAMDGIQKVECQECHENIVFSGGFKRRWRWLSFNIEKYRAIVLLLLLTLYLASFLTNLNLDDENTSKNLQVYILDITYLFFFCLYAYYKGYLLKISKFIQKYIGQKGKLVNCIRLFLFLIFVKYYLWSINTFFSDKETNYKYLINLPNFIMIMVPILDCSSLLYSNVTFVFPFNRYFPCETIQLESREEIDKYYKFSKKQCYYFTNWRYSIDQILQMICRSPKKFELNNKGGFISFVCPICQKRIVLWKNFTKLEQISKIDSIFGQVLLQFLIITLNSNICFNLSSLFVENGLFFISFLLLYSSIVLRIVVLRKSKKRSYLEVEKTI